MSSPIVAAREPSAFPRLERWRQGWVRYHEARYRYLGQILDCAALPCLEAVLPAQRRSTIDPGVGGQRE